MARRLDIFVFEAADTEMMMKSTSGIWLDQIPLTRGYLVVNRDGSMKYTSIYH